MNIKRRAFRRAFASVLSLSLLISVISLPAAAHSERHTDYAQPVTDGENVTRVALNIDTRAVPGVTNKIHYSLPYISDRRPSAYTRLTTKVNGITLSERAVVIGDFTYLQLDSFASAIGAEYSLSRKDKSATLRYRGMTVLVSDGAFVTYASQRPLFSFSPSLIMSDGKMYVPASALLRAFGLSETYRSKWSVYYTGNLSALSSRTPYTSDEVFWLARIITAESGGESLLGQIAVGDVILNRVKSNQFPNTIYGVIFDRKWGVQFSPTLDGSIYNTPTYTATLAAKICLEGTSLSDNAMYFLNPSMSQSQWITQNRKYAYSIGKHDFYL